MNGRSSDVLMTTSALVARIFPLRSASNPDITDSAMMGAPVPRKTPKIDTAVKTVNSANSVPSRLSSNPTPTAIMPAVRSRSTIASGDGSIHSPGARAWTPMKRGISAAAAKQSPPATSAATPTHRVRRERRSGSRRCRQATNHSNPGASTVRPSLSRGA